jgi:hypothetical protein
MTDTLADVAANEEELDQQQLAEQLLAQPRSRAWSWSARTGC